MVDTIPYPYQERGSTTKKASILDRPRSVSQVKQYKDCPHAYFLSRVQREWQRPAAWLPQGSAVHEAAEAWERSGREMSLEDAQDAYRESYAKHANEMCQDTPNLDWWFRSGPYAGEADLERRFELGLSQVERYVEYYTEQAPGEVIWITPEGTPAIELEFEIELDGVKVRGFIDQVIKMPAGETRVRDIKSGNKPGDDFQLATYKIAVEKNHGATVRNGDFWMGRNGKPTVPYDLSEWTEDRLAEVFKETDQAIRAERFDPDPEPKKCDFCPVQSSCSFSA